MERPDGGPGENVLTGRNESRLEGRKEEMQEGTDDRNRDDRWEAGMCVLMRAPG